MPLKHPTSIWLNKVTGSIVQLHKGFAPREFRDKLNDRPAPPHRSVISSVQKIYSKDQVPSQYCKIGKKGKGLSVIFVSRCVETNMWLLFEIYVETYNLIIFRLLVWLVHNTVANPRKDMPLLGRKIVNSCGSRGKNWPNNRLAPPPLGVGVP